MLARNKLIALMVLLAISLALNVILYNKHYYTSGMLESTAYNLNSKYFSELTIYNNEIKRLREDLPEQTNLLWGLSNNLAMTASYYQRIPKDELNQKMGDKMFDLALYLHQVSEELGPEESRSPKVIEEKIAEVEEIHATSYQIFFNKDISTNERIESWMELVDSIVWTKSQ